MDSSAEQSGRSRKKMSRIRRACDVCNVKRIKCDGNNPCSHCSRMKLQCTYLRQEKKRGRASDKYPKEIKKRKSKSNDRPVIDTALPVHAPIINAPSLPTPITSTTQSAPIAPSPTPDILSSCTPTLTGPPSVPSTVMTASCVPPMPSLQPLQYVAPATTSSTHQLSPTAHLTPTGNVLTPGSTCMDAPLGEQSKYPFMYMIEQNLRVLGVPMNVADELLECYFNESIRPPTKVFSILRPHAVLSGRRPLHPVLLLTILLGATLHIDNWFFAGSKREQTYRMMYQMVQERLVMDPYRLSYDELIAVIHIAYFQPWLAFPKDSIQWWRLACDTVKLFMKNPNTLQDEEFKEEERRTWWAVYVLDRILSFSFNLPSLIEDSTYFEIYIPCDETYWTKFSEAPMAPQVDSSRRRFVDYNHDLSRGVYGWFIPLAQIMAKLYEYKRDPTSPKQLQSIIVAQNGILHHNILLMEQQFAGKTLAPHSEEEGFKVDLLYAKYINMCIGFMTQYIKPNALISDFESDMEQQEYEKLVSCVEVLEQILKMDPDMKDYPFLMGFFLFTTGYAVLQVINQVGQATVAKVDKFRYLVNILVRVMESILIYFPAEYMRTLRNLLIRSLQDCEKLILLTDHTEEFKANARRRIEALRAYSWLPGTGKGLAT